MLQEMARASGSCHCTGIRRGMRRGRRMRASPPTALCTKLHSEPKLGPTPLTPRDPLLLIPGPNTSDAPRPPSTNPFTLVEDERTHMPQWPFASAKDAIVKEIVLSLKQAKVSRFIWLSPSTCLTCPWSMPRCGCCVPCEMTPLYLYTDPSSLTE